MKEVKSPKKPLIYYYVVVIATILIFNMIVFPLLSNRMVTEVDYGTFISMTEEGNIGLVKVESNQIIFTNKDDSVVYRTGVMDDPNLTERLYHSGAKFAKNIETETSPFLSLLITGLLPFVFFMIIGRIISKKMGQQLGGKNSMMFGMGKSNAKVYVQSTKGIHFEDVAGEDEAKENLAEVVDYLHNPDKYTSVGASMPKGVLLVGPQVPVKRCWQRQLQGKQMFLSFLCPDRSL